MAHQANYAHRRTRTSPALAPPLSIAADAARCAGHNLFHGQSPHGEGYLDQSCNVIPDQGFPMNYARASPT